MASLFLKAYGDNPKLRVLDFLLTFEDFDYSMKDIAKNSKVGYTSLKEFWDSLVKRNVVKQTRVVGKAKMYSLNKDNPEVKSFAKFYWTVTKLENDKILRKEKELISTV